MARNKNVVQVVVVRIDAMAKTATGLDGGFQGLLQVVGSDIQACFSTFASRQQALLR